MSQLTPNYNYIIEDLKAILVEGIYNSNIELIKTYYAFGERIYEEMKQHDSTYGLGLTKQIAEDLGKSQRTVQTCVKFAKEVPDLDKFLEVVEEGKAISWRRIANHYLVEHEEPKLLPEPEPIKDISLVVKANLQYLIDTATFDKDGLHLFLPSNMFDLPVDNK